MGVAVGDEPKTTTASYFFIGKKYEPGQILSISNILILYSEIVPTSSSYNELLPSNPKKQKSPTVFYSFINGWGFLFDVSPYTI
jgi:hypothetical protein